MNEQYEIHESIFHFPPTAIPGLSWTIGNGPELETTTPPRGAGFQANRACPRRLKN